MKRMRFAEGMTFSDCTAVCYTYRGGGNTAIMRWIWRVADLPGPLDLQRNVAICRGIDKELPMHHTAGAYTRSLFSST